MGFSFSPPTLLSEFFANQLLLFVYVFVFTSVCLLVYLLLCLWSVFMFILFVFFCLFVSGCVLVCSLAARTQVTAVCRSSEEARGQQRRRTMRATPTTGSTMRTTTRSPLTCTTDTHTHTAIIWLLSLHWSRFGGGSFINSSCVCSLGWCIMMTHVSS